MNIALLNMMSDAALKATDRQFAGLLAYRKDIHLHCFTFPEIPRSAKTAAYIGENYETEDSIRSMGLDALIITGANVSDPRMETQLFWEPLRRTMNWARDHACPTLCSCLASHAVMQFRFGLMRSALPGKIWGVFDHEVITPDHVLAAGLPPVVPVPQSRFNEVSQVQFRQAGLDVIIADSSAGVHLAASQDARLVLMQGHPEYDPVSLLKEYKREVRYFAEGVRADYPPLPAGIMDEDGKAKLGDHAKLVKKTSGADRAALEFPEDEIIPHLHDLWKPAAHLVFENWVKSIESMVG